VKYCASINTIGNSLSIDPVAEMPTIRSNNGFAGLSGRAVKYTALANVKKMRELLVDDIDVVGVGGVFSGEGKSLM
jgi:dihydroorotate dehydrogenase (fumarate)